MRPFKSIHTTLTWTMTLVAVLSVGMVGSFWVSQEYKKFNAELIKIKDDYITDQKAKIKQEIDRVMAYVDYKRAATENELKESIKARVYEAIALANNLYKTYQGQKSDKEIQNLIKEALRPLRFNNGRGYYFIFDMQGNNILHPTSPHFEGKNVLNLQDSRDSYLIQRMIKVLRDKGEGFLHWYWYKPDDQENMSEKIGFNKQFEPYEWLIGTGEYIEDFEQDVQREVLTRINTIRFGKDGYIFVYDFDATTLAHFKQKNLGVNRWDYTDANGTYVVKEFIRISQHDDGGFLEYVGTIRPSTGLPAPKIGYARAVKDWKWMVGAGVYVDSINAVVASKRKALIAKIKKDILSILAILIVSLFIIGIISRYIARKTTDNISIFTHFFEKAATESTKISDESVHFSEFKWLARSANQMVEERKKASASLAKLQEQLIRSRKMEALGVLAGGVAHDLNNVLSAMVGYPDLILANLPADSPHRKQILTIKDSGEKAASIVQDLLTLARRGVAQRVTLNINSIIENYIQSPEHEKIMKGNPDVLVTTNLDPSLMQISGSQIHLQTTIMNLVANAAEAQPNGGAIRITTDNRYIDLPVQEHSEIPEGEYVVLAVKDQGVGIAQKDLEHIFEPFFTKKHLGKSGTGLGMAVVWGTVQDHDGHIDVSTTENRGTTFELYFPVTRVDIFDMGNTDEIEHFHGEGESILVVDDLLEQRELAKAILTKLGYNAETAASGEAALEYLERHKVDLLVLDMIMEPGIDGLETYKQSLLLHPDQRAIIASGYTETDRVKAAISLGVGQYVKKPYTVITIGKAIKEELQRS